MSGQAGFYRGTTTEQVSYFKDKQKDALVSRKWPAVFDVSIDFSRVDAMNTSEWINGTIEEILGYTDEIVSDFAFQSIDEAIKNNNSTTSAKFCPKTLTINLEGFLGEVNSLEFVTKLLKVLTSTEGQLKEGTEKPNKTNDLVNELERVKEIASRLSANIPSRGEVAESSDNVRPRRRSQSSDNVRPRRRSRSPRDGTRRERRDDTRDDRREEKDNREDRYRSDERKTDRRRDISTSRYRRRDGREEERGRQRYRSGTRSSSPRRPIRSASPEENYRETRDNRQERQEKSRDKPNRDQSTENEKKEVLTKKDPSGGHGSAMRAFSLEE